MTDEKPRDLESDVLAEVVEALKRIPTENPYSVLTGGRESGTDVIRRVLNAAGARFGIEPDFYRIERALVNAEMNDAARRELQRLREWARRAPREDALMVGRDFG